MFYLDLVGGQDLSSKGLRFSWYVPKASQDTFDKRCRSHWYATLGNWPYEFWFRLVVNLTVAKELGLLRKFIVHSAPLTLPMTETDGNPADEMWKSFEKPTRISNSLGGECNWEEGATRYELKSQQFRQHLRRSFALDQSTSAFRDYRTYDQTQSLEFVTDVEVRQAEEYLDLFFRF